MTERNTTIDFMRGLAVFLMIFIHATAYFQSIPLVRDLWDYTHFAVPFFVFCSAFVYFQREKPIKLSLSYIWKRAKRLIIPYYLFLIPFFTIDFLTNQRFSFDVLLQKLMLSGGRDLSWLVILFLYLMILIPIIHFMYRSKRALFWLLMISSFLTSVAFLFITLPVGFRLVMWLPWSFFLAMSLLFAVHEKNIRFYIGTACIAALAFIITRDIVSTQGNTLVLTENKYPPNLYYLSYGIFFTAIIYKLHQSASKTPIVTKWIQPYFDFLSKHSYSLFFIHFLFVKLFVDFGWHKDIGWISFFVFLMGISTAVQLGINEGKKRLSVARH